MGYFRYLLIPFEAGYVSVFIKIVLFQIMNLVNDSCYAFQNRGSINQNSQRYWIRWIPGSIKDRIHRIWAPEIFDPKT